MGYNEIAHMVKMGGTVFFFSFFILVLVYVFWPKNKAKFKQAAGMPINDETLIPDEKQIENPHTENTKVENMEAKP